MKNGMNFPQLRVPLTNRGRKPGNDARFWQLPKLFLRQVEVEDVGRSEVSRITSLSPARPHIGLMEPTGAIDMNMGRTQCSVSMDVRRVLT